MHQLFWSMPIYLWFDLCELAGGTGFIQCFSVLIELLSWCWWWVDMLLIVQWFHFYHTDNKPCVLLREVCSLRLFSREIRIRGSHWGSFIQMLQNLFTFYLKYWWTPLSEVVNMWRDLKGNAALWMTENGFDPNAHPCFWL